MLASSKTLFQPSLSEIIMIVQRICKDNSKKFCPSCGNPTLLRASVTVAAPGASPNAQPMQVHLKHNFQYKLRGTKYSIPAPKSGSAKSGSGTGLILREDQVEYMRAKKRADGKREREEQKLMKGILSQEPDGVGNTSVSSWMDPDWIPEMISVGAGGKGRTMKSSRMDGDMPQIGYGRKNPNERRRKK
jgi:RNA-binding protein NOB1